MEPTSYRPIALTSCLSKLIERLVTTRLVYRLESNNILSHYHSGFRQARSTADPLMRLIGEVHLGFQQHPSLRTVLAQLDLKSAYNRVDHWLLLHTMTKLNIPPVYIQFYKGFLSLRSFKVRCGKRVSRSANERCGVPQGAVSSPFLFVIYMEDMLRTVLPEAESKNIRLALFADDLTIYVIGNDVANLSKILRE